MVSITMAIKELAILIHCSNFYGCWNTNLLNIFNNKIIPKENFPDYSNYIYGTTKSKVACICTHMYTMHIHTNTHTCTHTYTHMHRCTHTYTLMHAHTHTCTHIHTHKQVRARVHTHTHTTYTHARAHTHIHVHIHTCTHITSYIARVVLR